MKLLEILQKELKEFPEGMLYVVQDDDGEVKFGKHYPSKPRKFGVWPRQEGERYIILTGLELAEDRDSAIVTKDMWEKGIVTRTHETSGARQMKLLEILQRELKKFPEDMLYAVQDDDGEIKFGKHSILPRLSGGIWQRQDGVKCPLLQGLELAEDWDSTIVTKDMWERGKMKSKTIDSLQSKHKHAEMIALCAEYAQTMENPMVMFQFKDCCGGWVDFDLDSSIVFYNSREYRLKPKTHIVNGVEIPDLRIEPKNGDIYYLADPTESEFTYEYKATGGSFDSMWIERGLCYKNTKEGKQAAILHAKAMLGIA